jgi:hypothetical protein
MGERRSTYRVLVGNPEGMGPFRRPRRRRENNIKMYLTEVEWGHIHMKICTRVAVVTLLLRQRKI